MWNILIDIQAYWNWNMASVMLSAKLCWWLFIVKNQSPTFSIRQHLKLVINIQRFQNLSSTLIMPSLFLELWIKLVKSMLSTEFTDKMFLWKSCNVLDKSKKSNIDVGDISWRKTLATDIGDRRWWQFWDVCERLNIKRKSWT